MFRRMFGVAAILLLAAASAISAQELTTDAERSYRALRSADDVKTKRLAERWNGLVQLQEWADVTGKFKTPAKYVAHDPELTWVKLRIVRGTGNNRVVKDSTIPLEKLDKICQSRVRQIAVLAEKVAEAVATVRDDADESKDGAGGEMMEDRMASEDQRGGRGQNDGGLAGMGVNEVLADGASADPEQQPADPSPPVTVSTAASPLPALLPLLPGQLPAQTSDSGPPGH